MVSIKISSLQEKLSDISLSSLERESLQIQLADACDDLKEDLWTSLLSLTMGGPLDASVEELDSNGKRHSPISNSAVALLLRKNFSRRPEDKLTVDEITVSHQKYSCD